MQHISNVIMYGMVRITAGIPKWRTKSLYAKKERLFRLISWKGYQSTSRLEKNQYFSEAKFVVTDIIYPLLTSTKCSCPLFGQDIGISCADTFNQQENQLQLELCRKQNLQTRFLSPEKSRYRMSSQSWSSHAEIRDLHMYVYRCICNNSLILTETTDNEWKW